MTFINIYKTRKCQTQGYGIDSKRFQDYLLAKSSSGHKHALEEVLSDAAILGQMEDTKVAKETQELAKIYAHARYGSHASLLWIYSRVKSQ